MEYNDIWGSSVKEGSGKTAESGDKKTAGNEPLLKVFMEMLKKFDGKSEEDLINAITAEANARRAAGTLSDKEIDKFSAVVSPFLPSEKRKRLNFICAKIKNSR